MNWLYNLMSGLGGFAKAYPQAQMWKRQQAVEEEERKRQREQLAFENMLRVMGMQRGTRGGATEPTPSPFGRQFADVSGIYGEEKAREWGLGELFPAAAAPKPEKQPVLRERELLQFATAPVEQGGLGMAMPEATEYVKQATAGITEGGKPTPAYKNIGDIISDFRVLHQDDPQGLAATVIEIAEAQGMGDQIPTKLREIAAGKGDKSLWDKFISKLYTPPRAGTVREPATAAKTPAEGGPANLKEATRLFIEQGETAAVNYLLDHGMDREWVWKWLQQQRG